MTSPPGHFAQRCAERGIASVAPDVLRADIERSVIATMAGRDDGGFVEHVLELRDDAAIWRFRVSEGVFYAIVATEPRVHARTVITQEMLASYKARRKGVRTIFEFKTMRALGLSVKAAKRRNFRKLARANRGQKP